MHSGGTQTFSIVQSSIRLHIRHVCFPRYPLPAFSITRHITSVPEIKPSIRPTQTLDQITSSLIGADLKQMTKNILALVHTKNQILNTLARYYFEEPGKMFRSSILLLLSRALNEHNKSNSSLSSSLVLPKQLQLAEIVELIHTASLLHDDVIDNSETRRGVASVNALYSPKLAILAGDYLLAQASVSLSLLRNHDVTFLMSTVIANLVEGEVMQTAAVDTSSFDKYIEKTYLKTASLFANSCRGAALLAEASPELTDAATEYGKNLGIAFQIVDDMLDFVGSEEVLGKPSGADLKLGLVTAPVLYALEDRPELQEYVDRKFGNPGDTAQVLSIVRESRAIERTKQLAIVYCQKAAAALSPFTNSSARKALHDYTIHVLTRVK